MNIEEIGKVLTGENYIYSICVRELDIPGKGTQGWLLGKKLIPGIKNYKPSLFRNFDDRKYEDFIIGTDEDGNDAFHTCNEEALSNYFGKNPGAPHYLTPVYFTKDVLSKYYDNPTKYTVADGIVFCNGIWNLRLDNNHPQYIVAFLGDLGHLHHKEQLFWKSYNIPPQSGISSVAWKRGFLGQFADPEQADLFFKSRLSTFQDTWHQQFGWYLFKPLSTQDRHHLISLHIPATSSQKEFDEQVLSLTKIIIDSLNEKELAKGLVIQKSNAKGIDKLEAFLTDRQLSFPHMIEFLRKLQMLRSTSVAHRKSHNNKHYLEAISYFKIEESNYSAVFEDILVKAIWMINTLTSNFLNERA